MRTRQILAHKNEQTKNTFITKRQQEGEPPFHRERKRTLRSFVSKKTRIPKDMVTTKKAETSSVPRPEKNTFALERAAQVDSENICVPQSKSGNTHKKKKGGRPSQEREKKKETTAPGGKKKKTGHPPSYGKEKSLTEPLKLSERRGRNFARADRWGVARCQRGNRKKEPPRIFRKGLFAPAPANQILGPEKGRNAVYPHGREKRRLIGSHLEEEKAHTTEISVVMLKREAQRTPAPFRHRLDCLEGGGEVPFI